MRQASSTKAVRKRTLPVFSDRQQALVLLASADPATETSIAAHLPTVVKAFPVNSPPVPQWRKSGRPAPLGRTAGAAASSASVAACHFRRSPSPATAGKPPVAPTSQTGQFGPEAPPSGAPATSLLLLLAVPVGQQQAAALGRQPLDRTLHLLPLLGPIRFCSCSGVGTRTVASASPLPQTYRSSRCASSLASLLSPLVDAGAALIQTDRLHHAILHPDLDQVVLDVVPYPGGIASTS